MRTCCQRSSCIRVLAALPNSSSFLHFGLKISGVSNPDQLGDPLPKARMFTPLHLIVSPSTANKSRHVMYLVLSDGRHFSQDCSRSRSTPSIGNCSVVPRNAPTIRINKNGSKSFPRRRGRNFTTFPDRRFLKFRSGSPSHQKTKERHKRCAYDRADDADEA